MARSMDLRDAPGVATILLPILKRGPGHRPQRLPLGWTGRIAGGLRRVGAHVVGSEGAPGQSESCGDQTALAPLALEHDVHGRFTNNVDGDVARWSPPYSTMAISIEAHEGPHCGGILSTDVDVHHLSRIDIHARRRLEAKMAGSTRRSTFSSR